MAGHWGRADWRESGELPRAMHAVVARHESSPPTVIPLNPLVERSDAMSQLRVRANNGLSASCMRVMRMSAHESEHRNGGTLLDPSRSSSATGVSGRAHIDPRAGARRQRAGSVATYASSSRFGDVQRLGRSISAASTVTSSNSGRNREGAWGEPYVTLILCLPMDRELSSRSEAIASSQEAGSGEHFLV